MLIVVHLKSGRGVVERATRTAQASVIRAFVAQVAAAGDDDVLVVGDYNMIPDIDGESFDALNPDGFLRELSTYYTTGGAYPAPRLFAFVTMLCATESGLTS